MLPYWPTSKLGNKNKEEEMEFRSAKAAEDPKIQETRATETTESLLSILESASIETAGSRATLKAITERVKGWSELMKVSQCRACRHCRQVCKEDSPG